MSAFRGFPRELFAFFAGLEDDNSKAYWAANRATWAEHVREPVLALLADLSDEFPPMRMFRPNRDVRFAEDKSPYKRWTGATSDSHALGGTGYYLSVSTAGLTTGCGAMAFARDQLQRFRAAIDDDDSGQEFEDLRHELAAESLPVTCGAEPPLKTAPRGHSTVHPRGELLRWKGAVVVVAFGKADWMHTPEARDRIRDVWRGSQPLKEWIDVHVGTTDRPVRAASR